MLLASFSIYLDVRIAAGSSIGRKYFTKRKFRQTLGGQGLK